MDIWAAGVTLYYLIFGKLPFEGSNLYTLFENISSGVYTIPSWASESLSDFLKAILNPDPIARLTIPQIRKHEYEI